MDLSISPFELLVLALAACRGTQLILHDRIFEPFRSLVKRLGEYPAYLVGCPWCVSVWVGLGLVVGIAWDSSTAIVTWLAVALALSLLAVAFDRLFDRFLPDELPAVPPAPAPPQPPMPPAAAAALGAAQSASRPAVG